MADNKAGKFALGAVLAGVAGYVAGILTAPKEGAKTREELKDKAAVWQKDVEKELGDLRSNWRMSWTKPRETAIL
ncbi:YtxH domain-containing protein [Candidatus Saccharibacteria bacterium]|nr:YtxH domain-containing protein [Candidatus Saccharibacteria bacterium]HPG37209.1 YtxH domain-containing protein [Candidatus Saccharibacteria bacterium]